MKDTPLGKSRQLAEFTVIILAGGRGTRMGGQVPKPLVLLKGKPLIQPIIEKVSQAPFHQVLVVINDQSVQIAKQFAHPRLCFIPLIPGGTGKAVLDVLDLIQTPHVLITQADDSYFYRSQTLQELIQFHLDQAFDFTMGISQVLYDTPYTAVFFDRRNHLTSLSEDPNIPAPKYINCGLYAAKTDWLKKYLPLVKPSANGEIGLPFITNLGLKDKQNISVFRVPSDEWHGINTPHELAEAESVVDQ
jgi:bifunctional N-acetylglucosamine-1-phosphate-uridyltransferase/glucosamine-1-phosphate-acetyltransferase GlmU-like protein